MRLCVGLLLVTGCGGEALDSGGGESGDSQVTVAIECEAGERVEAGECVTCEEGHINAAGDPVDGPDTTCAPCEAGSHALDNDCLPCPDDFTSDEGAVECHLEAADGYLGLRDYGYLFWPGNHWVNWGSFNDVQHLQTGYYGLAIDVSSGNLDHLGVILEEMGPNEARLLGNEVITDLPTATLRYSVDSNGERHEVDQLLGYDGSTTNPSGLIDMGRFMQRVEIPEVTYQGTDALSGALQLASLPRHFVLTHRVISSEQEEGLTLRMELSGDAVALFPVREFIEGSRALSISNDEGEGWVFLLPNGDGVTSTISELEGGGLSFESLFNGLSAGEEAALTLTAVPSHAATSEHLAMLLNPEESVQVRYAQLDRDGDGDDELALAPWDPQRGLYVVSLGDLTEVGAPTWPDWNDEEMHNWYNRHHVEIQHSLGGAVSVPIAFDGGNNAAFYITGGSPLLRDLDGEPLGVPQQISKNWHESPYWYHLYSTLLVEPGVTPFEHTFAHAKWGEAYAVQHAQLALIGWGQNQQWDESSIGAWGESITYDPDMTLSRSTVDDVRPFLVDSAGEWGWTGNVGGASFLVYEPAEGFESYASHQLGRMRTHYEYTGPNLTSVHYSGVSADGKIEASVATQLGRTDDMVRAWYHLTYTFLEDVTYDRLALFQVAADRYSDNGFTRYAHGDREGVLFDEEVPNHGSSGYADDSQRGIAMEGEAPWVMMYDSVHDSGSLPEHLANVGFVVRDYSANIGGAVTTTPHMNLVQTNNGGWSQIAFELGLPFDPDNPVVPAGSVVTATVEYLVPPADKRAWYGEADYLTALPEESFQSTDMMLLLADGNHLEVTPHVGTLVRQHPVEIATAPDTLAAEFTLNGGLGYVPITFHDLPRPDGWRLEVQVEDGLWARVEQEVEGDDYWQAYEDAETGTFELDFNVPNRGENRYRLRW